MALFQTNKAEVDSFICDLYSEIEFTSNKRAINCDEDLCYDYRCVEKSNHPKIIRKLITPIDVKGLRSRKMELIAQF